MIKLGMIFLGLKKSKSISGILRLFLPKFQIFLEVFWFDGVKIVLNLSYVTMCLPLMHLRMVL